MQLNFEFGNDGTIIHQFFQDKPHPIHVFFVIFYGYVGTLRGSAQQFRFQMLEAQCWDASPYAPYAFVR